MATRGRRSSPRVRCLRSPLPAPRWLLPTHAVQIPGEPLEAGCLRHRATVAAATRPTIPQPGVPNYRVYVPNRQLVLVKESGEFGRVEAIQPHRIFPKSLAADPGGFVVYLPSSSAAELIRASAPDATGL